MRDFAARSTTISPEALALMGASRIGYIKMVRSDEVAFRYPGAPQLQPGAEVFALHAADGTPVMLAGSRESAMTSAVSHELEIVSLH